MKKLLLILAVLLLVGIVAGYTETFQNEVTGFTVGNAGGGAASSVGTYLGLDDVVGVSLTGTNTVDANAQTAWVKSTTATATNYWSIASISNTGAGYGPRVAMYDSGGSLIGSYSLPYISANSSLVITRVSSTLYYSINGGSTTSLGACVAQPYYISFYPRGCSWVIDDIVIGSSITDVVGLPPHTWFVGKDLLDPSVKGLFDSSYNNVYTDRFHYTISNSTGTSIQSYNITNPPTSGVITVTSGAASDYITARSVILSGGSTTWDKANYVTNDVGTISYNITSQYWNTTLYDYYLKVYKWNTDGTRTEMKSTAISAAAGTGTYTFTTSGTYSAVTILNYKSAPNTDYWLYPSDGVYALSGVQIFGYTYDGFVGQILPSVAVGAKQNGIWYNTTSNSAGYYNLSQIFSTGLQIDFVGSKSNYTSDTFNYTFVNPQTSQVDLTLIPILYTDPDPNPIIAHTGTAIGGFVKDDAGNYVIGATVILSNGTYSASYTVTGSGIYLFDNLAAQSSYTVAASKSGYISSSSAVSTGESGTITYHNFVLMPVGGTINGTTIAGYTIDASRGTVIASASLNLSNLSWSSLTSSSGTGFYQYGQLDTGTTYTLSGSKTGYTSANTSVTTGASNTIQYYNLYLQPTNFIVNGGAAAAGFINSAATLSGLPGATVRITNGTFSQSVASSSPYGAYFVDNLSPSTQYTIFVSMNNYTSASKTATTGLDGTVVYTSFYLAPGNTSGVNGTASILGQVTDSTTLAPVIGATVQITGGSVNTTTSAPYGVYYFDNLNSNTGYTVTVSCTNYTTQSVSKTTGGDGSSETLNIRLVPTGSSTSSGDATLVGQVIDASTLGGLIGVAVNVTGGASGSTIAPYGLWNIPNLLTNTTYRINVSKAGYTTTGASATTGGQGSSVWTTIYMYPSSSAPILSGTSIYGLVLSTPFNEAVNGATVICGGTTTTTDAGGFYKFENLQSNTPYTVAASASGYSNTSASVTTGAANSGTQQNLYLAAGYTVSVNCIDVITNATVTGATVTVNGLDPKASPATYSLPYGSYTFAATASGYYQGSAADSFVSNDKSITIYMQPTSSNTNTTGKNLLYTPHMVRMFFVDEWGNRMSNLVVTATPTGESTVPGSWLEELLGIPTNLIISSTGLNGTTGTDGAIAWLMVEVVQYDVRCVGTSPINGAPINVSTIFYPRDIDYQIKINTGLTQNLQAYPTYSLNSTPSVNETTFNLSMNYTGANTTNLTFYVIKNNITLVYSAVLGGGGVASYIANNTKGDTYTYGFNATNSLGQNGVIEAWRDITMKGSGALFDFGLDSNTRMWISLAFIFLFAAMWGSTSVKQGAFLTPFLGAGFFWYIGWLPASLGATIFILSFIGGLYYMRGQENKTLES